jgi:hypothetical protein
MPAKEVDAAATARLRPGRVPDRSWRAVVVLADRERMED